MRRDGSGFTKPTTAHTEFHRDHGRMVLSIPLTLGVRSGVLKPFSKSLSLPLVPIINRSPLHKDQVLVRINHKLTRPRVLADPLLLSFFSHTNWAELSLRKNCPKSRPQGSVFIEKGQPITACRTGMTWWPNGYNLYHSHPFAINCHQPPLSSFGLIDHKPTMHAHTHGSHRTLLGHMGPSPTGGLGNHPRPGHMTKTQTLHQAEVSWLLAAPAK